MPAPTVSDRRKAKTVHTTQIPHKKVDFARCSRETALWCTGMMMLEQCALCRLLKRDLRLIIWASLPLWTRPSLLAATGTKCSCTGLGGANHRQSYLYRARGGCCSPSNTGQRGRGAMYMRKQRRGGGVACEPWPTSSCQQARDDRSKPWQSRKLLIPPVHIPAGA